MREGKDKIVECLGYSLSRVLASDLLSIYRDVEENWEEEGKKAGISRRKRVRCKRRKGTRQCCCHNTVVGSNFVPSVSFYVTKRLGLVY